MPPVRSPKRLPTNAAHLDVLVRTGEQPARAPVPVAASLACVKRGAQTGAVLCGTCAGRVELKVYACSGGHGACAVTAGAGVKQCAQCAERRTGWPKQYDEVNLWPGVPGKRFNPSIIRWRGDLLMCFRNGWKGSDLYIGRVTEEYEPTGDATRLEIRHPDASYGREDPRLFVHKGQLHVVFAGVMGGKTFSHTNVLYACLGPNFEVEEVVHPRIEDRNTWEKNHAYFSHDGTLYGVYSIDPHVILKIEDGKAVKVHSEPAGFPWAGGERRGGAGPVRVGNEYWHFFHDRVTQDGLSTYRTGLYVFEAEPPFRPIRYVPDPLLWADHKTRPEGQYCAALFACGAVRTDDEWVVSHGAHDRWTELHKLKHAALEQRLVPVPGRVGTPTVPVTVPPVYGLYCEELPDRRRVTDNHLRERGITPIWWRSVHGASWRIRSDDQPTTPGSTGLVLGHWHLWQHLWHTGVEEAIIIEDDAIVPPNFSTRVAELLERLPTSWQFVFLGLAEPDELVHRKITGHYPGGAVRMADPFGTHCYMVRRAALPVLMKRVADARTQIDILIYQNVLADGHLEWYACHPGIAGQRTRAGEWPQST